MSVWFTLSHFHNWFLIATFILGALAGYGLRTGREDFTAWCFITWLFFLAIESRLVAAERKRLSE